MYVMLYAYVCRTNRVRSPLKQIYLVVKFYKFQV